MSYVSESEGQTDESVCVSETAGKGEMVSHIIHRKSFSYCDRPQSKQ